MARAMWSGFLSFGLVSVPVGLYSATVDRTVHFNQLHKGTSNRIRYKKVDEATGEEVDSADIVNGFDFGAGEYVVVTREELKAAAPGKSETIEISDFVDLADIDPIHFRQAYYLAPRGKGADRPYALLRQAMRETRKVAVATLVLRDKEHLVAIRPAEDVLILETMYFMDEIRKPSEELDSLPQAVRFEGRELEVAKQLVGALSAKWDPARYENTYRARVEELIEQKRAGHAVVFESDRPKSNVVDLMAALEASLKRTGGAAGPSEAAATEAAATGTDGAPTRPSKPEQQSFEGMSKAELLARAAELDVQGRSKMTKLQLVQALSGEETPKTRRRRVS